jgi:hypothetical protein
MTTLILVPKGQPSPAVVPGVPGVKTWICPINPAHVFYGGEAAWTAYAAHFDTDHQLVNLMATTPADAQILTDANGVQYVEFNMQAIFAKAIGRLPPFIHLVDMGGRFRWNTTGPFVSNYILIITGAGEDKGINPDDWFFYQGGPRSGSGEETFDAGPILLERTVTDIRLQAYPRLEDGSPNLQDKIDFVELNLRGFV